LTRLVGMAVAVLVAAGACEGGGERSAGPQSPPTRQSGGAPEGVFGSASGCRLSERYPRPWAQRPRYRMRVAVRPDEKVVVGLTRLRFTPDLATDRLVFRLWPNAPGLASRGADLSVDDVRRAGGVVETRSPDPTTLEVLLDEGLEPGDSVRVRLTWRLRLPGPSLERISRRGDAVHLGSFFPLLAWEPGIGWARDPATNVLGETAVSPVAAFTVKVVAPRGLDVLASGTETRRGTWRAPSMRDFALAVGPFDEATTTAHAPDEVAVTVGVTEGLGVSAKRFAAKATRALESLARRFGPYPWSSFNLAVLPDLGGSGIEYPAMVFQGEDSLSFATTHEVAHMWFYGLVGSNPAQHPWLDEGLATWSHASSDPDVLERFLSYSISDDARNLIGRPMTYWGRHEESYFEGVYAQSVQALDELGPTHKLDCALREYIQRFAHRIAKPDDLIRILADHFPAARQTLERYGV
jgi:Peptidase family M1 domain